MKIGMVSDSLGNLAFEPMLDAAAQLGIHGVEMNTGNWSAAPHLDLKKLLSSNDERARFLKAFADRGLEIVALNANGNQLHPTDGERQSQIVDDTVKLAGLLGVETVSMMSGLPGGSPNDQTPNWIVSSWPPETQSILQWQWEAKLVPYWHKLAETARANGVTKLCIELHGNQLVYNVPTLLKLRGEIGPIVGANLDPSHLFWMDADPIAAVDALGDAIHHVHAKDTFINPAVCSKTSRLENGPMADVPARAWNYITLGHGHDERWWRNFCYRLRMNGYDGWLSIEHEDVILSRLEGVRRSVELLNSVMPVEASDYVP
ncbi:MAG: sugar phosphate isomerase/epimerase [Rhizobiaceae bacterium]|nr:sugar phosphate isomerase/epimerase [Rhizobiaceae bacterium]